MKTARCKKLLSSHSVLFATLEPSKIIKCTKWEESAWSMSATKINTQKITAAAKYEKWQVSMHESSL